MTTWWHILKSTERFGTATLQETWDEERAAKIVTAGYGNAPDGPGRDKLRKYATGDHVIVYAPRFGAIAVGKVIDPLPEHTPRRSRHDHAHSLRVEWESAVSNLRSGVSAAKIKAAGGYVPRTLAMSLAEPAAGQ